MDSIFIDTDIILDLIQKREPYYNDAVRLFSLVEEKQVVGYVSPLIFANVYYILRKTDSKLFAIQTLVRLKTLVRVITLDEKIIELALSSGFKDFEDAIQKQGSRERVLLLTFHLIQPDKPDQPDEPDCSFTATCPAGDQTE